MKIDISHKMRVLSLIAFGGVMLIHSAAPLYSPESATWNRFFAGFLCESLTQWAVPFFFFGSGFWLGKGRYCSDGMSYGKLLKGKVKSLLLPYFAWAVIGAFVGVPLVVGTNIISHMPWAARTFLGEATLFGKIDNLLGLMQVGPMHCGVLWFVRALLFCFVLAPIWKNILKIGHRPWVLFVLAMLAVILPGYTIPYIGVSTSVFGQFTAGIAVAKLGWIERPLPRVIWLVSLVGFVILLVHNAVLISQSCEGVASFRHWYIIILGMITAIGAYDNIRVLRDLKLHPLALETFWLYVTHQMIAAWIIAITLGLCGKGNCVTFLLVFATPVVVIPISLIMANLLKDRLPAVFAFLTGGRGGCKS